MNPTDLKPEHDPLLNARAYAGVICRSMYYETRKMPTGAWRDISSEERECWCKVAEAAREALFVNGKEQIRLRLCQLTRHQLVGAELDAVAEWAWDHGARP